jgi:hypothetical protein
VIHKRTINVSVKRESKTEEVEEKDRRRKEGRGGTSSVVVTATTVAVSHVRSRNVCWHEIHFLDLCLCDKPGNMISLRATHHEEGNNEDDEDKDDNDDVDDEDNSNMMRCPSTPPSAPVTGDRSCF